MSQVPADWYPDPHDPTYVRWWDGTQWTQHVQPAPTVHPHGVAPVAAGAEHSERSVATEPHSDASDDPASRRRIGIFGARAAARDLSLENEQLRATLERIGALDLGRIQLETHRAGDELSRIQGELLASQTELESLRAQMLDVRHAIDVQEFGLYDFENPAEASLRWERSSRQSESRFAAA